MRTPNNTNPNYDKYVTIWNKCQAAVDGQEAIQAGGENYLPKLPNQKSDLNTGTAYYEEYRERAVWYEATGRTVELLRGLAFRKAPEYEVPAIMEPYLDSLTAHGRSACEITKELTEETLKKYRVGLLLDMPEYATEGMTIAEQEAMNVRPYVSVYTAETILDWKESLINNKLTTSFISLLETAMIPDPSDEFNYIEREQVRVLDLSSGLYRVRIFNKSDDDWILTAESVPLINGAPLNYIPFFPITPAGETWNLKPPSINGLVNLNIAHYRNDASYRNGLMMSGAPTAVFSGLDIDKSRDSAGKIRMGANATLHLAEGGQAFFLHVGSDGFTALKTAGDDLQNLMALIGARILATDKKAAETAETTAIKASGENSILADMVNSISGVFTKVLKTIAVWIGQDPNGIYYKINNDFLALPIDPQLLTSMLGAVQSGLMSPETLFYNLERGELIAPDVTFDEEKERIAEYIGVHGESLDDPEEIAVEV